MNEILCYLGEFVKIAASMLLITGLIGAIVLLINIFIMLIKDMRE